MIPRVLPKSSPATPAATRPGLPLSSKPTAAPRETISPARPRLSLAEKAAIDREQKEKAAADRNSPTRAASRRFWLEKEKSRTIVILDASLNDTESGAFSRYEHNLQDESGKWGNYQWCLKDIGHNCPICKKLKRNGTLTAYLTILDFREWKDSKDVVHSYERKILPVSGDLMANLLKKENSVVTKGKSLRGMVLNMERGDGEKAPRTGMPVEFELEGHDTPVPWYFLTEEQIKSIADNPLVKLDSGQVIKQPGEDLYAYDYSLVFGAPDIDTINEEFGGTPVPGSANEARKEWETRSNTTEHAPSETDEVPGLGHEQVEYEEEAVPMPIPTPARPTAARPAAALPAVPVRPTLARPAVRPAVPSARPPDPFAPKL